MPITQLSSLANTIQLTMASAERVFDLLDEPEEPRNVADAVVIASPRGHVQFDHVEFSYKPDAPLISDVSFDVQPGQTIAIVGPTGAGKTTLVNLLMRFYDVNAGRILVDGVDIQAAAARRPATHVRHGAAGHLALWWDDSRQHRLRPRRRHRGGDRRGGPRRPSRPLHPHLARELRHRPERRGRQHLAGAEAAADDRSRVPVQPSRPHPGRSHQQRRHPHRGPDPGCDEPADARAARAS